MSNRSALEDTAAAPEAASEHALGITDLPALRHYVRQGRCALFVGAGLSAHAGLPCWKQLMERLIPEAAPLGATDSGLAKLEKAARTNAEEHPEEANPLSPEEIIKLFTDVLGQETAARVLNLNGGPGGFDTHDAYAPNAYQDLLNGVRRDSAIVKELQGLLAAGKYPDIAGFCRDLLGRRRFHDVIRSELRRSGGVTKAHEAIVRTPYACIVTTNFDKLLEEAFARWGRNGVPKAPTGAELAEHGTLLFDDAFFILKAHGDLDDESSIIFTSEDYRRVIHSNPAFQAMITGILQRYALLFVGYSLSDTNFRLLLDNQLTIFNEHVPPRYAVMGGVGEAEKEILWRTAKLRVVTYGKDKRGVSGFLRELASTAGGEEAPGNDAHAVAVGLPGPKPARELSIRAVEGHMVVTLRQENPGEAPRTLFSGGCGSLRWSSIRSSLRRVLFAGASDSFDLNAVGAQLREVLPPDLLSRMDDTPPECPILLSLAPETETLPWEWLIVAGSRLCLRNPVVRRPVGISNRARGLRLAGEPLRALVIGDADKGNRLGYAALPRTAGEASEVAKLLRARGADVTHLEREAAVYSRLVSEVESGGYDIVHFTGHASSERSDALLSLWDGRVSSSELASILSRQPPTLLVLNSRFTAFAPCGIRADGWAGAQETGPPGVDRPLPPALGFTAVASRAGAGAFVGSFSGALRDDSAAQFSIVLYRCLLDGQRFVDAVHAARKETTTVEDTTGLCYAASGYPDIVLARRRPSR